MDNTAVLHMCSVKCSCSPARIAATVHTPLASSASRYACKAIDPAPGELVICGDALAGRSFHACPLRTTCGSCAWPFGLIHARGGGGGMRPSEEGLLQVRIYKTL